MATADSQLNVEFRLKGIEKGIADLKDLSQELKKVVNTGNVYESFTEKLTPVMDKLTASLDANTLAVDKSNSSYNAAAGKINTYTTAADKVYRNVGKASESIKALDNTLSRSAAQANRFNFGNINAQLQDIIVTSQMGMKPLTVALQQGTQLVYILQQSKAPLKDFVAGLKSFLSPLTLTVVGLVGATAALIQWVNWSSVAKTSLNTLAKGFDYASEHVKGLTLVLTGLSIYLTATFAPSLLKVVKVLYSLIKVLGATAVAFTAANAPALIFIGSLLAGLATLYTAAVAISTVIEKIQNKFKKTGNVVEKSFSQSFKRNFKDYAKGLADLWSNTPLISGASKKLKSFFNYTSDGLKNTAAGLGENTKEGKKTEKVLNDLKKSYEDLIASGYQDVDDIRFERSLQGMSEYDTIVAKTTRDLEKQVDAIRQRAEAEGVSTSFLNGYESKIKEITGLKAQETLETEKLKKTTESYNAVVDYGASATKSFVSDLENGLKQGKSIWESFTNAVLNMLDKIIDKMMDLAIDAMFNSLKSSNGSGSWIGNAISAGINYFTSAKGSAWDHGVQKFAAGGVVGSPTMFGTRSGLGLMGEAGPEAIMPLRRGSDGSLGVKADGIGGSPVVVNVINNSNAQARTEQRQTSHGVEIDVMIDEMVAKKIGTNGTASNNALRAYSSQQLVMR